ncbi:MAG: DUF6600 domain-containing protein [Ignavibacteria bacterium]
MLIKNLLISSVSTLIFLLTCSSGRAQQNEQMTDSLLLEKIKNIDVSLNSIDETDENLFLNSVSFESFYDDLSPAGDWIQITKEEIDKDLKDGEGQAYSSEIAPDAEFIFIWHPTVTEEGWRPYTNGRWEYTANGWMWVSNYTWGWAVFHYGRWWNSSKYGWVWLPGYVWAPAWVQWRITDNHIGWCPLTPNAKWNAESGITDVNYTYRNRDADWVFVEKNNFFNNLTGTGIIKTSENGDLITRSKTILSINSDNNGIINNGPDVKDIESKTGKPVKQKVINFWNIKGKPLVGDNDISVYKENFKKLEYDSNGKVTNYSKPRIFKRSE